MPHAATTWARVSFLAVWTCVAVPGLTSGSDGGPPIAEIVEALAAAKRVSVSGTVTAADSGLGVPGVTVALLHLDASLAAETETGADGTWELSPQPGTFYVRVSDADGLIGGLFDGVSCPFGCDVGMATPVTVDGNLAGIDFALTAGGRISGRVTDAATGEPMADVALVMFDHTGQRVSEGFNTDEDGRYSVTSLPAGIFYVGTLRHSGFFIGSFDTDAYLDRVYGGVPCYHGRCNALLGTPVEVQLGEETAGIDVALTRGGSVSGTVVDQATGEPVAGTRVAVRDAAGDTLAEGESDAEGRYTASGLLAGTYVVQALAAEDHPGELYQGVACTPASCDLSMGTPVDVALDADSEGVDFTVRRIIGRGSLSGRVTDRDSGEALPDVKIHAVDHRFRGITIRISREDGTYRIPDVPADDIYLHTSNTLGYFDEIYEDVDCGTFFCNARNGTPVAVADSVETIVDFELVLGGSISGRVTDDAGQPVSAARVNVHDPEGRFVANGEIDADGRFEARPLPAGDYLVFASAFENRFDESFDGILCYYSTCDITATRLVGVELGVETGGVDFVLDRGVALSGHVVDEATGKGVAFPYDVDFFDEEGNPVWSSFHTESRYTVTGLLPGSYFVRISNQAGFVDQVYTGLACPNRRCDVTAGTPVMIDAAGGTDGIDFALARGGSISGSVTELETGLPFRRGVGVSAFDAAGTRVAFDSVDANGDYRLSGLPGGSYFVRASSLLALGELHGAGPCILDQCDVNAGTPFDVRLGEDTPGVDFALALGGTLSGTITSRETGEVVLDAELELFREDGSPAFSALAYLRRAQNVSGSVGAYRLGALPAGTYFVRASAPGFAAALYDGLPCAGECDVTAGAPVTILVNEETSGIDFELR